MEKFKPAKIYIQELSHDSHVTGFIQVYKNIPQDIINQEKWLVIYTRTLLEDKVNFEYTTSAFIAMKDVTVIKYEQSI